MEECIVENDQVHLLCWVLLVELIESLVATFLDRWNIWACFIHEWCLSNEFIEFIVLIISLEVSEEIISHELFVFITK